MKEEILRAFFFSYFVDDPKTVFIECVEATSRGEAWAVFKDVRVKTYPHDSGCVVLSVDGVIL